MELHPGKSWDHDPCQKPRGQNPGHTGPKGQPHKEKVPLFGLPVTGVVDYNTWYEISAIYVAVTRIAELM